MKRFAALVFAIAALAALAVIVVLLARASTAPNTVKPALSRRSVAEVTDANSPAFDVETREPDLEANIPLASNETLLDVLAFNLDADQEDEQVLVAKRSEDALIRVIVADYDGKARSWRRAWEGTTGATKIKTFQVTVKDLVGDRNLDLVCGGMNEAGEQTMTVFWRSVSGEEQAAYSLIASIAADSIFVEETDRPESYKLGQTNGESWKIAAFRHDPESENLLDQIRETWAFNFRAAAYELENVERIPGAQIAQRTIAALLTGDAPTFERFLDGIWYRETDSPTGPDARFVVFDPFAREIHFIADQLIESYDWEDSHATRYGIFVGGRSMAVSSMRRLMDVELSGADMVGIRIFQDLRIKADISERWNGAYRKMGSELADAFARKRAAVLEDASRLEGVWQGEDGASFTLADSGFSRTRGDTTELGGKALFSLGTSTVLQLRSMRADGLAGPRESYKVLLAERSESGRRLLSLELVPVRVTMDGVEATGEAATLWERTLP